MDYDKQKLQQAMMRREMYDQKSQKPSLQQKKKKGSCTDISNDKKELQISQCLQRGHIKSEIKPLLISTRYNFVVVNFIKRKTGHGKKNHFYYQ